MPAGQDLLEDIFNLWKNCGVVNKLLGRSGKFECMTWDSDDIVTNK